MGDRANPLRDAAAVGIGKTELAHEIDRPVTAGEVVPTGAVALRAL
jgi:hypothetical protein